MSPRFKPTNTSNGDHEKISEEKFDIEIHPVNKILDFKLKNYNLSIKEKENSHQKIEQNFFDKNFNFNINKESTFFEDTNNNNSSKDILKESSFNFYRDIRNFNKSDKNFMPISSNFDVLLKLNKQDSNEIKKKDDTDKDKDKEKEKDKYKDDYGIKLINDNISIDETSNKPKIILKFSSSKKLIKEEIITNTNEENKTKNTIKDLDMEKYDILNTNNSIYFPSLIKSDEDIKDQSNFKAKNKLPKSITSSVIKVLNLEEEKEENNLINSIPTRQCNNFLINTKNINNKKKNSDAEKKIKLVNKPPSDNRIIINKNLMGGNKIEENKKLDVMYSLQEIENNNTKRNSNIIQRDNIDETSNSINKKDIKESIFRKSKNNPLYIWKKD
jgi:hypothetical protein